MAEIRLTAPVKCFMVEDLHVSRYRLRRYAGGDAKCPLPKYGYHNAESDVIAEIPDDPEKHYCGTRPPVVGHDDPRWPAKCACGYAFVDADPWQINPYGLYKGLDGAVFTWEDAPVGAVRDAYWGSETAWMIKLPGGDDFMTEQKAKNCACPPNPNHRCWTVVGAPPAFTVSPSIQTLKWHGWLRAGMLTQA